MTGTTTSAATSFWETLERLLDALPLGSMAFAGQVGSRFWADPSPKELKAIATIAEGRCLVPKGPARQSVVRSVGIRQRIHRLHRAPLEAFQDSATLEARSAEWQRVAQVTREVLEGLPVTTPQDPAFAVFQAARELLSDPVGLEAEADLETGLARLADAAQGGPKADPALADPPIGEGVALLEALAHQRLEPGDPLFLQVWVACVGTRLDLSSGSRVALERHRRLLQRLSDDLEERVTASLKANTGGKTEGLKLAPWRRFLQDTRTRLHEALTRPAQEATGPIPLTLPCTEENLVERLRKVRSEYEPVSLEAPPTPSRTRAWIRKIFGR